MSTTHIYEHFLNLRPSLSSVEERLGEYKMSLTAAKASPIARTHSERARIGALEQNIWALETRLATLRAEREV